MGRRAIAGVGAGLCLSAALVGCGSAAGPSDVQIAEATLPALVTPPNDHSDTGGCALITPAQVAGATGAQITRTSSMGTGCAWSRGEELVASLRQNGNQNGNGARVFAETLATQEGAGPVQQVSGLGAQAFTVESSAPTVWWLQAQQVYAVSVELAPAQSGGLDAALQLAKIASGNLPG